MKIITAADETFMPVLARTLPHNLRHGPVTVHQAEAPATTSERRMGRLPNKPDYLLASWQHYHPMVWLDADAWIIRSFAQAWDFDIAVTMRRQDERAKGSPWQDIYGYLNTGVVFVNGTGPARAFLEEWRAQVKLTESRSDQQALNTLVRQVTDLTEYNRTFERKGVRIRILQTDEYNWFYFDEGVLPKTKILHMKTDMRARHSLDEWTGKTWGI